MRLWRLTRAPHAALDGEGAVPFGTRYAPAGHPLVSFASEPGLAVLVTLRYIPRDLADVADDYVLGWTEIEATALRIDDSAGEAAIRDQVANWLARRTSLLAAVRSKVLPEADVVMMNPRHPDAAGLRPLVLRPFSFVECLHTPPMLEAYERGKQR